MPAKEYKRIGETLITKTLGNGLAVNIIPKKGFHKFYAYLAVNYGSVDSRFSLDGVWRDTPDGVAHFLEHKMFDTPDGNALTTLSKNGASPNAYTSTELTAYYLDCTEKFEENLRILLDFVTVPYFTAESVAKEQGIIGQEIGMYDDSPQWKVYFNMLGGLYKNHPVRINIAGTAASIAKITADTLYECHKAFYVPSNMTLCVVGDVEPERIYAIAEEIIPAGNNAKIGRDYNAEDHKSVNLPRIEEKMEVQMPQFMIGFKNPPSAMGAERMRQKFIASLAADTLFGMSSPLYARLYAKGLINKNFDLGFDAFPDGACLMAGGESRDPDAVLSEILGEADRINRDGFDAGLFGRLKKAAYGERIRLLDSFESQCRLHAAAHFTGGEYFSFPEVFDSITADDAAVYIRDTVKRELSVLSVILPGK